MFVTDICKVLILVCNVLYCAAWCFQKYCVFPINPFFCLSCLKRNENWKHMLWKCIYSAKNNNANYIFIHYVALACIDNKENFWSSILKAPLYRTQTQTQNLAISSANIALLKECGFPRESFNTISIKTQSFAHLNYYNKQIIDYKDDLSVTTNSTILQVF